jgi:Protein of unknown function (DUF2652)/Polyketide cyclase / dehydrase and lipid transport
MASGTFVLADIGGYTSFLAGVGIDHGKEITEHLLNGLIKANDRRWKVGNVMGDCVLFYSDAAEAPEETYRGVQSIFHAFQDAQVEIASFSTCMCGACNRTEELSLKFVVHSGEFQMQNIAGRKELMGSDIVLATRLLKNSVPVTEYVIATAPGVVQASGVTPAPGRDHLDGIGPVEYAYIDLQPVREAYRESREFYLTESDSKFTVSEEIAAPADVVWASIKDLAKRRVWQVTMEEMDHVQGGNGEVGEVHTCLHGGREIVHYTLAVDDEARRKTERLWVSPPIMKDTCITMEARPLDEKRTKASLFATFQPRIPVLSHLATPVFIRLMKGDIRKDWAALKEYCETGKVAAREAAASGSSP